MVRKPTPTPTLGLTGDPVYHKTVTNFMLFVQNPVHVTFQTAKHKHVIDKQQQTATFKFKKSESRLLFYPWRLSTVDPALRRRSIGPKICVVLYVSSSFRMRNETFNTLHDATNKLNQPKLISSLFPTHRLTSPACLFQHGGLISFSTQANIC